MPDDIVAVFFDHNGTLQRDAGPGGREFEITNVAIGEIFPGLCYTPALEAELCGVSGDAFRIGLFRGLGQADNDGQWEALLEIYYSAGKLFPSCARQGVKELVMDLCAASVSLEVVSNGHSGSIRQELQQMQLASYFDFVTGKNDLPDGKEGKPAPDLYLQALKRKNIQAVQAVAIEDSVVGAEAALAAGLKVIFCPEIEGLQPPKGVAYIMPAGGSFDCPELYAALERLGVKNLGVPGAMKQPRLPAFAAGKRPVHPLSRGP